MIYKYVVCHYFLTYIHFITSESDPFIFYFLTLLSKLFIHGISLCSDFALFMVFIYDLHDMTDNWLAYRQAYQIQNAYDSARELIPFWIQ